jgi:hypothetical protein
MAAPCRRSRLPNERHARVGLGIALLLAACQPLPHPFAGDVPPPGSPLLNLRDNAGVTIAPILGAPRATADKLAPALAKALQEREIAAAETAYPSAYQLAGRIEQMSPAQGQSALVAVWELRDPAGKQIGETTVRLTAPAGDWQDGRDAAVLVLAEASAKEIAAVLQDEAPAEVAAGGRLRLRIDGIGTAPGDGEAALASAITTLLKRQGVAIIDDPAAKADLEVEPEIAVAPSKAGKQHVKIVWHVRQPGGGDVGTVAQENDVPAGLLDGAWGDLAYNVALAAQDGIMALVARATPPPGATAKGK